MENFKKCLQKSIQKNTSESPSNKTDEQLFLEEFLAVNIGANNSKEKSLILPKFFHPLPKDNDELKQKLREEARAQFLQRRSSALLDNEELKGLYSILESNSSPASLSDVPTSGQGDNVLDYDQFKKVRELCGEKSYTYLTAKTFAKLQHGDPHGRISVMALFNYVMRKVWLKQTRIGLSLYDVNGQGFLREQDVENYISELIETLPQLNGLDKSFHSFYVCTAVRKFFFFLDPLHTGKIRIQDVLACSFLDDLLELRDQDLAKDAQEVNWFSAPSALRVYGQYLNLDKDHNGMLSKDELMNYGSGSLTPSFVTRVFEECLTYEGEMDYKTYLDFVLAMENRKEPQSLMYFFRILDVGHRGYLNSFSINFFFRDIVKKMSDSNQEPVRVEDVKDEIFDMVRPKDALKITLQDMIDSGSGETVVSILIDLNGFYNYENREVNVNEDSDQ